MDLSFTGTFDQRVDAKGRMSIPSDLRRVLEQGDPQYDHAKTPRMVVLYGPHLADHLRAYTIRDFQQIATNIRAMKRGSIEQRRAAQLILAHSVTIEVDKDGRVVLPKKQREKIALEGEVRYAGMGEYFEIWNKTATEDELGDLDSWLAEMGDGFDPLSMVPDADGAAGS